MPSEDDLGQNTSPFAAQSIYPADTGATNPELAAKFLEQHRADMAARQPDIDNTLSKMQLSTDQMSKILDDTTEAIKASRRGQMNMPLMAMAAGMLSNRGNFGNQLGEGFKNVIPAVQKDREMEDQMHTQLANLALKKSSIEQAPLEAKLAYYKALQTGDIGAARAIEQALIRAQSSGQGNAANNPKLIQKTVQDALAEARKQVDLASKDMDMTGDEKEAEVRRRVLENLRASKSAGIPIPEEVFVQFGGSGNTIPGAGPTGAPAPSNMGKFKSYFDQPTPEMRQQIMDKGLPPPPAGYVYDSIGRKERPAVMQKETEAFRKDTKGWDDDSAQASTLLGQIDTAERILDKNPKVVGPQRGVVPNRFAYNYTNDAQTIRGVFNNMQLHAIPKGQGAVSNMERELFASASPNMEINAAANKNLMGILRQTVQRDRDRREFYTEYWNAYRTRDGMDAAWDKYINSPQGSAFKREADGSPVPNTERMPWREFFKTQNAGAGPRRDGGYITLGDEYDD